MPSRHFPSGRTAVLFLAAAAVMLFLHLFFRRRASYGVRRLDCQSGSPERLIALCAAKQYSDDLYEGKTQRNGICFTVRIFRTAQFRENSFQELRAKARGVLPEHEKVIGLFTGGRYAKVHFIVCDRVSAVALGRIAGNTKKNLNRTEMLFYAVLSLEDEALYLPEIFDGLEYLQVKRYAAFCDLAAEFCRPAASP